MRIHTSHLSEADIRAAGRSAGVTFERLAVYGSRSHVRAFDVILAGSGRTGGQWGNSGTYGAAAYTAATWDEWGIFLGALFDVDPAAKASQYSNGADFHYQTADRFHTLTPAGQHKRHKWTWGGDRTHYCACGASVTSGHLADYLAREGGNVFEGCPGY